MLCRLPDSDICEAQIMSRVHLFAMASPEKVAMKGGGATAAGHRDSGANYA
jgi:hypothetical protein